MGIAALFGEIPVPREILHYDILIMVAASVLIAPFVLARMNINRIWGAGFLAAYILYVVTLF
jgi:cation:H+ antiporter